MNLCHRRDSANNKSHLLIIKKNKKIKLQLFNDMQTQNLLPCSNNRKKIPNESICLDCLNYAEKLRLTSDRSFTFIKGRQTFYDKPTSSEDNTLSKLDMKFQFLTLKA